MKRFNFSMWGLLLVALLLVVSCSQERLPVPRLSDYAEASFGVPIGTIADRLILDIMPNADIHYFNTVLDAVTAVKDGEIDVVVYDEPILRNAIAKVGGLMILGDMVSTDEYGFAVTKSKADLCDIINNVIAGLHESGVYDDMFTRWFPAQGDPAPMPELPDLTATNGTLKFATAAIVEPFSFFNEKGDIVGFDIEMAYRIAQQLQMDLEIVNVSFAKMLEGIRTGEYDIAAASITITDERAETMLFSEPNYIGGMAAAILNSELGIRN